MPIREDQLNGRIATLIDRMSSRWRALGENKGAFRGNEKQPDVLIISDAGGRPIVLENEYEPANTVEMEAIERLGEYLDADIAGASGRISAAVALRSPDFLRNLPGADAADKALAGGATLEYALFTGLDPAKPARFPKTGFIRGDLRDLAAFIAQAATPEDAVELAADILEKGVQDSADLLRIAAWSAEDTQAAIVEHLKQPYGKQTVRMAATIIINALVFHQNLAGQSGIQSIDQLAAKSESDVLNRSALLAEWRKILGVNYYSIFRVASDLLISINPPRMASNALQTMRQTAERLIEIGVSRHSDLSGAVFQRLISDRKFLATFYTRPASAALLAHLAMPDDAPDFWADPDRVKNYSIADYACGTGALIHAAYRRLNRLHWLAGGDPQTLHAHMMERALTAIDVLPSAVHLTASSLSDVHPTEGYAGSQTIVTKYGRTERGVSLGSLDMLAPDGGIQPLISMHASTEITATGETETWLAMPHHSQDLVIMNPPFTKPDSDWDGQRGESYHAKHFHGLSTDVKTQKKMSQLAKEYGNKTCAHGFAGLGSWFAALAHRMVKPGGTIALILPMTSLQGASWRKFRKMIADGYRDVTVMTIAADSPDGQSFSADTGMAETMIVCRESSGSPSRRGIFVSFKKRPANEMESLEIARAISAAMRDSNVRRLEDGPFDGSPVSVGGEIVGQMVDAPLSASEPWAAVGISDFAVSQTARHLAQGTLWLPSVTSKDDAHPVPMATVGQICQVGIQDQNIVGNGRQTAFIRESPSSASTYPMLWSHDAKSETRLIVAPDSEGRVKRGRESRAGEIWETRSHAHHNRDFRFNSQPLAVAYTERETIGGRAWPNLKFADSRQEIAHTLWANTTLGILSYWHHSTRQQVGRGMMPITALRTMPTLDVRALSDAQLEAAANIFADLRDADFLPANEAYRDDARKDLDNRVLSEMLELPPEIIAEPLALLRLKWCSEPSVHGGKGTAPG